MKPKRKVTVTSTWLNEEFIGNDKDVFTYLTEIKKRQNMMLDVKAVKMYTKLNSKSFKSECLQFTDYMQNNFPNIGLNIKIETLNNE